MRRIRFQPGDVIVLQGAEDALSEVFTELGLLPLAERNVQLGGRRRAFVPVAVLAIAMIAISVGVVPATVGFFGAATLLVVFRSISLRELYTTVEWPIIVLLGCLIPVSDAIRTTGGTELIAGWLSHVGQHAAGSGRRGDGDDRGDAGDAVPEQRGDRAGHGARWRRASPRSSASASMRS